MEKKGRAWERLTRRLYDLLHLCHGVAGIFPRLGFATSPLEHAAQPLKIAPGGSDSAMSMQQLNEWLRRQERKSGRGVVAVDATKSTKTAENMAC